MNHREMSDVLYLVSECILSELSTTSTLAPGRSNTVAARRPKVTKTTEQTAEAPQIV